MISDSKKVPDITQLAQRPLNFKASRKKEKNDRFSILLMITQVLIHTGAFAPPVCGYCNYFLLFHSSSHFLNKTGIDFGFFWVFLQATSAPNWDTYVITTLYISPLKRYILCYLPCKILENLSSQSTYQWFLKKEGTFIISKHETFWYIFWFIFEPKRIKWAEMIIKRFQMRKNIPV